MLLPNQSLYTNRFLTGDNNILLILLDTIYVRKLIGRGSWVGSRAVNTQNMAKKMADRPRRNDEIKGPKGGRFIANLLWWNFNEPT